MSDPDKAQFLRSEITIVNQRLAGLEGSSSAYLQRWVSPTRLYMKYNLLLGNMKPNGSEQSPDVSPRMNYVQSQIKMHYVSTRLRALRDLLESLSRAEDIVKVHEARLTEKETTSLTPGEVEDYVSALKVQTTKMP